MDISNLRRTDHAGCEKAVIFVKEVAQQIAKATNIPELMVEVNTVTGRLRKWLSRPGNITPEIVGHYCDHLFGPLGFVASLDNLPNNLADLVSTLYFEEYADGVPNQYAEDLITTYRGVQTRRNLEVVVHHYVELVAVLYSS